MAKKEEGMTEDIKRLDLVDVIRDRLRQAGLADVFSYMPDSRKHPECTVIRFGVPGNESAYFDMTFDTAVRVTVLFRRIQDLDAMADAQLAERTLRSAPLDSMNGSYRFVSIETIKPRPVLWDESGRDVWVVEATVHIEMKEL